MTIAALIILLLMVIVLAFEIEELRQRVYDLEGRTAEDIAKFIIDRIDTLIDRYVSERVGGTDE